MLLVGLLAVLAAGCGDAKKQAQEARAECEKVIAPFMDEVNELDSRLDIGLAYTAYSEHVADANVAYDRIDLNSDILRDDSDHAKNCRQAARAGESALNSYVKAQQTWQKCAFDDGVYIHNECGKCVVDCDGDDIAPLLRGNWSDAHRSLAAARRYLKEISPTTTSS
jgi:hypothetical protein